MTPNALRKRVMELAHDAVFSRNLGAKRTRRESKPASTGQACIKILLASVDPVIYVKSVFEWLKRRAHDQQGLGSKPTRAILLCPWEGHLMALSLA